LATLLAGPSSAAASVVYDWQGTCTLGCTGTATGELTLTGGTPTTFTKSQFVSFEFTSSDGTFFLDNTSPYLNALGGGSFGGMSLEENAFGPNTLPLWQFASQNTPLPTLTQSPDPGIWQFLYGSYFWQCLDANCTAWTNDVIRNVGVDEVFSVRQNASPAPEPMPEPSALSVFGLGLLGLGAMRRRRR
jgi:hypothetical protein